MIADVNPNIHVPELMLSWIISNVAYLMLPMQMKQAKHYAPGGSLYHRISDPHGMYPEISRNCELMYKKLINNKQKQSTLTSSSSSSIATSPSSLLHPAVTSKHVSFGAVNEIRNANMNRRSEHGSIWTSLLRILLIGVMWLVYLKYSGISTTLQKQDLLVNTSPFFVNMKSFAFRFTKNHI
jgi:hypothetical protein